MARSTVVIGAGMGGLSAAIHARLEGWDVLVVEAGDAPGGKAAGINESGFMLDPGPSIIILPRLYEAVFARAGRRMSDELVFDRLPTLSRVYFEGEGMVDLPADYEACLDLLRQVAPKDLAGFEKLMASLDQVAPYVDQSVFSKPFDKPSDMMNPALLKFGIKFNPLRDYKMLVDGYFESPLLRSFFYGFPSYGGQTYRSKAPGAFMIPYYMLREGVFFPRGGVRAIPQAFYRLARSLGVEFQFNTKVSKFVVGDRPVAIETTEGERIEAEQFISNVDPWTLPADGQPKSGEPSFSYFTCHWGIKKKLTGFDHHTLFVPSTFESGFASLYEKRRFPDRPIVYVNDVSGLDPEAAPDGHSLVFAVVTSPAAVEGIDWVGESAVYRDRVRGEIARAGIEWSDEDVVFERIQNPLYFAEKHGNYKGSLYGPDEEHRLWGIFPLANRDPRYGNVAYCGGAVQPGAGLPMATLSGQFAVQVLGKSRR